MGLFHRRPKPVKQHDCRYREAWRNARGRANAHRHQRAELEAEAERDGRERDQLRKEVSALRELTASLARDLADRPGVLDALPVLPETGMEGLAAELVIARRRATAATQRAELTEKRANRLDELLARAEGRPHAVPEPA